MIGSGGLNMYARYINNYHSQIGTLPTQPLYYMPPYANNMYENQHSNMYISGRIHPKVPFYPNLNPYMQYNNEPALSPGHELFQNPLQPDDDYYYGQFNPNVAKYHPYPKPTNFPNQKGGQLSAILNSFKSQNGTFDVNKMVNTTGQLVNAISQVSNMAKGLGGIFKA